MAERNSFLFLQVQLNVTESKNDAVVAVVAVDAVVAVALEVSEVLEVSGAMEVLEASEAMEVSEAMDSVPTAMAWDMA